VARYQKKHSPTHTHPDHQKSSINFVHLLRSIASSWFNLRASQSFSTGPVWSTPWSGTLYFILHTFLHPIIIFFLQHMIGHKKHTKLKRLQVNCKPVGECCCQAHTHTHTHTHTHVYTDACTKTKTENNASGIKMSPLSKFYAPLDTKQNILQTCFPKPSHAVITDHMCLNLSVQ